MGPFFKFRHSIHIHTSRSIHAYSIVVRAGSLWRVEFLPWEVIFSSLCIFHHIRRCWEAAGKEKYSKDMTKYLKKCQQKKRRRKLMKHYQAWESRLFSFPFLFCASAWSPFLWDETKSGPRITNILWLYSTGEENNKIDSLLDAMMH